MTSNFVRPPPAPVFNPTLEEFTDPISYVHRISPIAFNYGICKIRPPSGWKPPFSVDQENFTFVPRVQELSDVCAYNRVRYHFITSLIHFWEAQDVNLFVPQIKGKSVDIYRLWKQVKCAGGYSTVCEKKLWCKICEQINLPATPSFASVLSSHYKKYLLPYDTFLASEPAMNDQDVKSTRSNQLHKKKPSVGKMVCSVCKLGNDDEYLLLCDGCDTFGACHTYCLDPPLSDVPKGNWYCRDCVIRRYKQLNKFDAFGFKSSKMKYTLHTFGIHADDFKAKHFGKPTHMVSLEEAETEFWRLVNSEDTEVSVEYGADLNAHEHGSGFPTLRSGRVSQKLKHYINSPWNLNNTPLLDGSALRFLPRDISGMIIPWCYVGMAFSCFCWHTEDHWSYSINYLHMGEPKTWYGVPTNSADAFELAMRSEVPELFVNSPDLLHHMTTMVSPHRLQAYGVPVYRLDQMVGEFVVTFPRAFHAGFNQGFNFAEAVNFCPPDWFEYGRNCIEHYALLHRTPVFSHSELLCRMAKSVEPLSIEFLTVITKQLGDLLTTERCLRRHLARIGVRLTERMVFENSEDEKRECDLCRTTLYLSSLGCKCSESMVCLAHYQKLTCCSRDNQVMRYRYDLDELTEFKERLQQKLTEYEEWKCQLENNVFNLMPNKSVYSTDMKLSNINDSNSNNSEVKTKLDNPLDIPMDNCDNGDSVKDSFDTPVAVAAASTAVKSKLKDEDNADEENEPPVCSRSSESTPSKVKPEEKEEKRQKPTLLELNELLNIGRTRQYPSSMVSRLNHIISTINECSSVIDQLIMSYKKACERVNNIKILDIKSSKSDMTDSGNEDDDDDDDNDDDDGDDEEDEEQEEAEVDDNKDVKKYNKQRIQDILNSSGSIQSTSEESDDAVDNDDANDNETSGEDCHNSSGTSLRRSSRRLNKDNSSIDDDDVVVKKEKAENISDERKSNNNNSNNLKTTHNNYALRSTRKNCNETCSYRTRSKSSASKGPFISKITLNEFASIVKLTTNLPVVLPELSELQDFADHITAWRNEVCSLLAQLNKKLEINNNNNNNTEDVHSIITDINMDDAPATTTVSTAAVDVVVVSNIDDGDDVNSRMFDANKVELQLRSILPSVLKVKEYIDFANMIDIELPELNQLKRVHDCLIWLEDVDKILNFKSNNIFNSNQRENDDTGSDVKPTVIHKPTLNDVCKLQLQGNQVASSIAYVMNNIHENGYTHNFASCSVLDTALTVQSRRLLDMVSAVKLVEESLEKIIQAEPRSLSLSVIKERITVALQLPIHLTIITDVQEIYENAKIYEKKFNCLANILLINDNSWIKEEKAEERESVGQAKLLQPPPPPQQQQQQPLQKPDDDQEISLPTQDSNKENITVTDAFIDEIMEEIGLGSLNSTPSTWLAYLNTLEEKTANCVVKFPQIDPIKTLLSELNVIHEKLVKLFLRPESTQSLLEVLLPRSASALEWLIRLDGGPDLPGLSSSRSDGNNCPSTTYKRHTRSPNFQALTYRSLCKHSAEEFAKISSDKNCSEMYESVYSRFIDGEISLMHYLRSTNMRKSRAKHQEKVVYCICRQPGLTSFMLQCELCRDWVHNICVTLPSLKDSETERMRYICPRCECSLRPDLKQVLEVLVELHNLTKLKSNSNQYQALNNNNNSNNTNNAVNTENKPTHDLYFHQFPEFVAVQLLCDRAISFIKHIQKSIASNTELRQALEEYEHFSHMTMPSFDLIEENITEALINSSDENDDVPVDCKKKYQRVRTISPSRQSSTIDHDRSSVPGGVRDFIPKSVRNYRDAADSVKTQPHNRSYLSTGKPRAGMAMPLKTPWKPMNSAASTAETQMNRNPEDIRSSSSSSSSSSRLPNVESQFSDYKQSQRSRLLMSNSGENNNNNSNRLRINSGEQKEAEAAEALAGLSASLSNPPPLMKKDSTTTFKPTFKQQRSYDNVKLDGGYNQLNSRGNIPAKKLNQRDNALHDNGFSSRPTDRSDSTYFKKSNSSHNLSSTNHHHDSGSLNRLNHSRGVASESESTKSLTCLQSTRRFFFPLPSEARRLLEKLIMEACLLEVHLPQTRWLWQLHLASDQETAACGAHHPTIAKLEEERLKRRIARHLEQISQLKQKTIDHQSKPGRRKRKPSSITDNSGSIDTKLEQSDDSNVSSSEKSVLQNRQRYTPVCSEPEDKQSNSPVSDTISRVVTSVARRKPYRPRGGAPEVAITRRYKLGRPKRALPVRSYRSIHRPTHAIGYRSVRTDGQQQAYVSSMRDELEHKMHRILSTKNSKLRGNNRTTNLRSGRVYRGERIVRRPFVCSNNDYSDSSVSEEHVNAVEPTLNEQYSSRNESSDYCKMMMTSNHSNYNSGIIGGKRSEFRSHKQDERHSSLRNTNESEQYEESASEDQLSNNEDEKCPAKPCHNPRTGTVKWVQCEACCQWYHQICVGIRHQYQLPKVYYCPACQPRSSVTTTAGTSLPARRKRLSGSGNVSRLSSRHFLVRTSSKLHIRKNLTGCYPGKLSQHLSRRPDSWTRRLHASPRLPKLQAYGDRNTPSLAEDDDGEDGSDDTNNYVDNHHHRHVKSSMKQSIPILKNELIDNWADISQSSEESSLKHPVNSPHGSSSHLDEPPVIDAYEPVPNNYGNTETITETPKGPTEVLLEALDVMSSGEIHANNSV
uniref:[histone H3]-trimethyl-L-lysine(4) demethylase n=1 Tax=Trichobilharzia regenti TaxID=157069 RepID=A0AA85KJM0_TRIRE|nr:unnamed protein product [Trichobilharzia regenti]